jgi:DNA-binding CsgD family transcriptional regulator
MASGVTELDAEARAVVEVIEREFRCFWLGDVEAYRACHVQAPYACRWGYWQGGGIMARRGADQLMRLAIAYMQECAPVPEFVLGAGLSNLTVRVTAEMAWATFERGYFPVPRLEGRGPNCPIHEVRILERHDSEWKIAFLGVLDPFIGEESTVRVSADGTITWWSERAAAQLADDDDFIVRGGRLRLRHRNLDGRLRAAIAWAAEHDDFIMSRKGAVPIVIDTNRARVCWVIADGDITFVMLDDPRPVSTRIAHAARIYGLSDAQLRVAQAVAEGVSLPDFAQSAGITVNTARTHLQRIFDKVGTRTQAGLVHALLSIQPPR